MENHPHPLVPYLWKPMNRTEDTEQKSSQIKGLVCLVLNVEQRRLQQHFHPQTPPIPSPTPTLKPFKCPLCSALGLCPHSPFTEGGGKGSGAAGEY